MTISQLTNKELKNILRENNVKNYSKLNKKNLLKKVNQLIKKQNGGVENSFLPELPKLPDPLPPTPLSPSELLKRNKNLKQTSTPQNESENVALEPKELNSVASAPPLNNTNKNTNIKKEECGPCSIL
jgi:hypothetical protein